MFLSRLELLTHDLTAQRDFYENIMGLRVRQTHEFLEIQVGETTLVFKPALADFEGAYHFAFNIPQNQFPAAKVWI